MIIGEKNGSHTQGRMGYGTCSPCDAKHHLSRSKSSEQDTFVPRRKHLLFPAVVHKR